MYPSYSTVCTFTMFINFQCFIYLLFVFSLCWIRDLTSFLYTPNLLHISLTGTYIFYAKFFFRLKTCFPPPYQFRKMLQSLHIEHVKIDMALRWKSLKSKNNLKQQAPSWFWHNFSKEQKKIGPFHLWESSINNLNLYLSQFPLMKSCRKKLVCMERHLEQVKS